MKDAVQFVRQLKNQQIKVPVTIYLTSLDKLFPLTGREQYSMDLHQSRAIQAALDDVDVSLGKLSNLTASHAAQHSRRISYELSQVYNSLQRWISSFKGTLKRVLADAQSDLDRKLEVALSEYKSSVFNRVYLKPLLEQLEEEDALLQALHSAAAASGVGWTTSSGIMEIHGDESHATLALSLVPVLPEALLDKLDSTNALVNPNNWVQDKDGEFVSEVIQKFHDFMRIKRDNRNLNCFLHVNYESKINKASIRMKERGNIEHEVESVDVENVHIESFFIAGRMKSRMVTMQADVEVLTKNVATGQSETQLVGVEGGRMDIALESLGLHQGLTYELQVSLCPPLSRCGPGVLTDSMDHGGPPTLSRYTSQLGSKVRPQTQ